MSSGQSKSNERPGKRAKSTKTTEHQNSPPLQKPYLRIHYNHTTSKLYFGTQELIQNYKYCVSSDFLGYHDEDRRRLHLVVLNWNGLNPILEELRLKFYDGSFRRISFQYLEAIIRPDPTNGNEFEFNNTPEGLLFNIMQVQDLLTDICDNSTDSSVAVVSQSNKFARAIYLQYCRKGYFKQLQILTGQRSIKQYLDLQNYNLDTLRGRIAINTLATLMMAVAGAQASQARSQSSV